MTREQKSIVVSRLKSAAERLKLAALLISHDENKDANTARAHTEIAQANMFVNDATVVLNL